MIDKQIIIWFDCIKWLHLNRSYTYVPESLTVIVPGFVTLQHIEHTQKLLHLFHLLNLESFHYGNIISTAIRPQLGSSSAKNIYLFKFKSLNAAMLFKLSLPDLTMESVITEYFS